MVEPESRSADEVLDDHLRESKSGSIEDDLRRNYADDVVLLTGRGLHRGHEGVRTLNEMLSRELPKATFEYRTRLVDGEVGFLEWSARSDEAGSRVDDGADSYVIQNGKIVAQTIHYTVESTSEEKR